MTINNLIIHWYIIYEYAYIYFVSTYIFKKLGSLELSPSLMTPHAYDGQPFQLQGLLQNVPIELVGKTI